MNIRNIEMPLDRMLSFRQLLSVAYLVLAVSQILLAVRCCACGVISFAIVDFAIAAMFLVCTYCIYYKKITKAMRPILSFYIVGYYPVHAILCGFADEPFIMMIVLHGMIIMTTYPYNRKFLAIAIFSVAMTAFLIYYPFIPMIKCVISPAWKIIHLVTVSLMAGVYGFATNALSSKAFVTAHRESAINMKINNSLAKSFTALAYCNIIEDSFREVLFSDGIRKMIGEEKSLVKVLQNSADLLVGDEYQNLLREFFDIRTLDERLKSQNAISLELFGQDGKLYNLTIIEVSRHSETGALIDILIVVQSVNKEVLTLRDKLHVEETLISCLQILNSGQNTNESINKLLKIITNYHEADRAYIFDLDYHNYKTSLRFKYQSPESIGKIGELQDAPLDSFSRWFDQFEKLGCVVVSNLDKEVESTSKEYQLFSSQDVSRIYTVPLIDDNDVVTGFFGLDNPRINLETEALLKTIATFVQVELEKQNYLDELQEMSYTDKLTGLKSRRAYMDDIETIKTDETAEMGVIFVDINGLKATNDRFGHEQGDMLINNVAMLLRVAFSREEDTIYRIGGDEFVVFCKDVMSDRFVYKVEQFVSSMGADTPVSVGSAWKTEDMDLDTAIKAADQKMYENKREFYQKKENDRRLRSN